MLALVVRFDLRPRAAEAFDRLVHETIEGVRGEAGTLIYACHAVDGDQNARVLYEVYRDRAAFEEHERQEHVRRFLAERGRYLAAPHRVEFLVDPWGKGAPT